MINKRQMVSAILRMVGVVALVGSATVVSWGNRSDSTSQDSAITSSAQVPLLPLVLDGSKTPSRIPDRLAYFHFILANAEHDPPSAEDFTRRRSIQVAIGLDGTDADSLGLALRGVRDQLDGIQIQRDNWLDVSGVSVDGLTALKRQEEALLDEAQQRVLASLSAEGQSALNVYFRDHVKTHILVFGDPTQP